MTRPIRWHDLITINSYWFALSTRSQTISPLIIPLLVQLFVGEEIKGSAVGQMRLWALMTAVLVQALAGMLSDRSTSPLGRRRPFILFGTVGEVIVFTLIGFSTGLSGETGYWVLFGLYIFSMIFSNTAQAGTQGLIPDLSPESMRGRFSGVKAILELPLPLIFVSVLVGPLVARGEIWTALILVMAVLILCAAITMTVKEQRQEHPPFKVDWRPFLQLVFMTAVFTLLILGMGAIVQWFLHLPLDLLPWQQSILTAAVGVAAMTAAVGVGVIASLRIGMGKEVQALPSFKWWVVNRLAFLAGSTNVATFLLFFLQERFSGMEAEKAAGPASRILLVVGIFILLTAFSGGWLADRYGKKILIIAAGVLSAFGMGIIILFREMSAVYIGGSIVGVGIGLFYSANWALGTEIVPREQAGRFLGMSNLAGAGAGAIGAYIGGPIADSMGYTFVLGMYTILFLISIIAVTKVKENQQPG